MPSIITVSDITGSTPFQVYLCPSGSTSCYFISNVTSSQLPYSFNVPIPLSNNTNFCLQVIDYDGCKITNCFTLT